MRVTLFMAMQPRAIEEKLNHRFRHEAGQIDVVKTETAVSISSDGLLPRGILVTIWYEPVGYSGLSNPAFVASCDSDDMRAVLYKGRSISLQAGEIPEPWPRPAVLPQSLLLTWRAIRV